MLSENDISTTGVFQVNPVPTGPTCMCTLSILTWAASHGRVRGCKEHPLELATRFQELAVSCISRLVSGSDSSTRSFLRVVPPVSCFVA